MTRARWILLAAAGLLLTGMAHNHLVKSEPSRDAVLTTSPAAITLWFAERPEVAFTSVTLMRADSTRIATIKAVPGPDSMAVSVPLPETLLPGSYLVAWRTASVDGHAVRGVYGFSISP